MVQRYRVGVVHRIGSVDVFSADWLGICRRIVAAQRAIFDEVRGAAARTEYEGMGEGGDHTLVIDRRCEDAVFTELERLAADGASFVAVSEERGEVAFGSGGETRVVIDPIDGSLNARRTIPSHSLSIAVASGSSMADVELGYVYDFGADEEFVARHGEGASLGGEPIRVAPQGGGKLEVLGVESAEPEWGLPAIETLAGKVYRLRVVGSIAITAAYVGAGRFDGMLSLRPCRSVDAAAAQLIVREAGGRVAFGDLPLEEAGLGLEARYPIAAAADAAALAVTRAAQKA
jgi:myo-inositol-1(or 4)-monophosphatase